MPSEDFLDFSLEGSFEEGCDEDSVVPDEPGGVLVWLLLITSETEDDVELSQTDVDCAACSDFDDDSTGDVNPDIGTSLVGFPSGSSMVAEMYSRVITIQ